MSLRIILADDEPIARMRLRTMLSQHPENTIVAECKDGRQLMAAIASHAPQIVFTDIEMPGIDGFEVVSSATSGKGPLFVFTTAYPSYAARAFDVCALDYLVKPIEDSRLADCLRRAERALQSPVPAHRAPVSQPVQSPATQQSFFVRDGIRHTLIDAGEIDWIEAADYYASLHVRGRSYLVRQTLQHLSETLDPARFCRVHRSAIVNVGRVQHSVRDRRHGSYVVLRDGSRVKVSPQFWKDLIAKTQQRNQQ